MEYIAFLRGINVSGNHRIKMTDLKSAFESLGCMHVQTVLASGNVRFSIEKESAPVLTRRIEACLEKTFGFSIPILLRSRKDIQKLIAREPFKKIKVTPETRLHVTFLTKPGKGSLKAPYRSKDGDFQILEVNENEILSALILSDGWKTTDAMDIMLKEFGNTVTTRNWNTVCKMIA
ncbi:DUF1697 domain-containing protein [Candidatus Uhrbacteria bacterium]|nr:DUF1697 domain-containing protein [Candidatus Uhrbacteria bacterium]